MTTKTLSPADLTLFIERSIDIDAPIETAFAALLDQLGPFNETPGGAMPMVLEAWPGGRWYRDLGQENGHLWGHVQVIKRPTLLEITGPLFMSYAAVSHLRWKLTDTGGATRLALTHGAIGIIDEQHQSGVQEGWQHYLEQVRDRATASR